MKTIGDVMTVDVVWVSPSARVKTAVILMKGHNIGALPVVQTDNTVAGLVTYQSLLGEPPESAVSDVMKPGFASVTVETSVHDAARIMHDAGESHLLVLDGERLAGIVSHQDLILELGRNFDPLTGLPWADAMREWAVDALKQGQEISILLFDLDDFGLFNKKYSHPTGDRVLQAVAEVFKAAVDPEVELLCRYAGDEFGIVSLRNADDCLALAQKLQDSISRISIPELAEKVSATYGTAGGRRTREREDTHFAATVDTLITRASKDCTAHKPYAVTEAAKAAPEASPADPAAGQATATQRTSAPGRRLKIQSISITTTETEATVTVTLSKARRDFARQASGYSVGGSNTLRLVAEAAAGAACKSLAPGHGIVVDEVLSHDTGKDEEVITVVVTLITPRWSARAVGSSVVKRGDRFRAVAAALLSAVNRQVEELPESEPEDLDLAPQAEQPASPDSDEPPAAPSS